MIATSVRTKNKASRTLSVMAALPLIALLSTPFTLQTSHADEPHSHNAAVTAIAGADGKGNKILGGEIQAELAFSSSDEETVDVNTFKAAIGGTNQGVTGHAILSSSDTKRPKGPGWKNEITFIDAESKTTRYIQVRGGPSFQLGNGDLHLLAQIFGLVHQREADTTGIDNTIAIATEQKLLETLKLHAELEAGLAWLQFREKSEDAPGLNISSPGLVLKGKVELVYRLGQRTSIALHALAQQSGGKAYEIIHNPNETGNDPASGKEYQRDIGSLEMTGGLTVYQSF